MVTEDYANYISANYNGINLEFLAEAVFSECFNKYFITCALMSDLARTLYFHNFHPFFITYKFSRVDFVLLT